jgi:hypothetical protein
MKKIFILLVVVMWSVKSFSQNNALQDFGGDTDFFLPEKGRVFTSIKPLEQGRTDTLKWKTYLTSLHIKTESKFIDYLLNKDFVRIKGDGYDLRILPVFYLEYGQSGDTDGATFFNTRGIKIEGELGRQFAFQTAVYENHARFPRYLDTLFTLRQTGNGFPAVVPGFGISKLRKNDALDFPSARGHITYKPSEFFMFRLGHDTFFIGEGERSLLLDDKVPPYPYFQIVARFWNIRYVVMWSMIQDVRAEVTNNGFYYKKYMAAHYLDWAITDKVNLGLFENVIWDPGDGRGFDVNFLNPVIFFKAAELQSGTKGANTVLGMHLGYRPVNFVHFYGQFLLDEMTVSKFFGEPGYWGNKFGLQLGVKSSYKYRNHLLFARLEYNRVRPYTYSHHRITINYGHDNYPLAHPWGANLTEILFRLKWKYKRYFVHLGFSGGAQGVDFPGEPKTYGADIYRDYEDRISSDNVKILQGNLFKRTYVNIEAGYKINPVWNWEVYLAVDKVKHSIEQPVEFYQNRDFTWLRFGMRANMPFFRTDW